MTLKFDTVFITDVPVLVRKLPDYTELMIQACECNASNIFVASSAADILSLTKRFALPPGKPFAVRGTSDDELWAVALTGETGDILMLEADSINVAGGGFLNGGAGIGGTGTGPVTFVSAQGAVSATNNIVSPTITSNASNFYLASFSIKDPGTIEVLAVSGLGLTWTRVAKAINGTEKASCEVWKGTGTPTGNGAVSATITSAREFTMIISQYAGVNLSSPIEAFALFQPTNKAFYHSVNAQGTNGGLAISILARHKENHTPGSGFTQRLQVINGGGPNTVQTIDTKQLGATGLITIDGTIGPSDTECAGIGLTLKGA